jgi:hypothetical protein
MTYISNYKELGKILKEFIIDLNNTFKDKLENNLTPELHIILNTDSHKLIHLTDQLIENIEDIEIKKFYLSVKTVDEYIKILYPKHFFNILYQNISIFTDLSENTFFLPNIEFKELFFDTTSITTQETIWKYLQSILLNSINSLDSVENFGDTAKLFEAIDSDNFKSKLENVVQDINNLFNTQHDISNTSKFNDITDNFQTMFDNLNNDTSNNNDLPTADKLHEHINKLINGKIGTIAKELAEQTVKDLEIDENNTNPDEIFKKLIKNPAQLMGIVKNIGNKLDEKMKDGSIDQSELLKEATDIFHNMKSMPGMGNIEKLMKSMNLGNMMPPGTKFNANKFEKVMEDNLKKAKMKERMQEKMKKNIESNLNSISEKLNKDIDLNTNDISKLNDNLDALLSYINSSENTPRKSNKKNKKNKNK